MTSEWIEVVNDEDIMYLNNMYDDFEDALIVKVVTIKFIVEKKAEGVLGFYKAG